MTPSRTVIDTSATPHARLRTTAVDAVRWTSGHWAERFEQACEVSARVLWELLADPQAGHVLDNFRAAAGMAPRRHRGTRWQDAWLYKWIEAAACLFRLTGDDWLRQRMDEGIGLVRGAVQPDGYIATYNIVTGNPRFANPHDHEVYCMGHLLTAAVIHRRMTGDDSFFEVALRVGDFLCRTLGKSVEPGFAHNPSAIMGLVELYRETRVDRYLDCAKLIVDMRGHRPRGPDDVSRPPLLGTDMIQDRVPLREEREVVGHNVFFTYLFSGAADVYMETGDRELLEALERLWEDLAYRKMNVNGGVSPMGEGVSPRGDKVIEAVGPPYYLPNATAYNETCGQVGNLMWNQRMFLIDPQPRYAEMVEWEIYNGILPGVGLDGASWWYRNPLRYWADWRPGGLNDLASRGQPGRSRICCPTNVLRTIAQFHTYMYCLGPAEVWVNHYGASWARLELDVGVVELRQETQYPWDGRVALEIVAAPAAEVAFRLRVPSWACGAGVAVGGSLAPAQPGTYITLTRRWRPGDRIELLLPIEPRLLVANPKVEQCRNQAVVARGPVLYCLEACDLPDGTRIDDVYLSPDATFEPEAMPDMPFGVVALRCELLHLPTGPWKGELYRELQKLPQAQPIAARLIPYMAWANRGRNDMTVWLPLALGM